MFCNIETTWELCTNLLNHKTPQATKGIMGADNS